jgi:CarboxypepD_reg-like domain/TonB dependent receptor
MKKATQLFFLLGIMIFSCATIFAQGSTTSSINGKIYDEKLVTLPGASVLAIHTTSGTRYSGTTDENGSFRISNMRVGGPYTIQFSFLGYTTKEETEIYLQLGDSKGFKVILKDEVNQLNEVVVKGLKDNTFNSKKTGAQTIIDSRKIASLPSLSRNIADFARLTPQAQLRGDDVLSIGGQNNRFNAIYIDGAVNNDVFGLAANGTNGGQTGVSPISIDAIEQFQVSVAPYDVKQSGFVGGSISAITRSGTNNFEGSAYFFNRDQSLAGKTPPDIALENPREKLADFTARTFGVRAGGSIIKDKLFYFVNFERQDNADPSPFNINNYTGNIGIASGQSYNGALAATKIQQLQDLLLSRFGYSTGDYTNNTRSLLSDKLIAKIDYNFNDKHKISFKHSLVKANNFSPSTSSRSSINFVNGAIDFESITNSSALELSSRFNNKYSNNLVIGYTKVDDDRNPSGNPFPNVQIRDGAGSIFFGSERFSTANILNQEVLTITDNFEIVSGINTITIGTHNEFSKAKNVFVGSNFGFYRFAKFEDFIDNKKPEFFNLGYSLKGGEGDNSQGAAEFKLNQYGFYAQNDMQLTDNFKFSYGVRFDLPFWEDGTVNEDFNTNSVPLLEVAGKDLKGARVGKKISLNAHIAPRVSFNYNLNGTSKTQIRGGLGVFTSRLPLVWPGGAYNNNGVTQGSISITGITNANMPSFNPNPSVESQISTLSTTVAPRPGSGKLGGNVDLFSENFKLPQVFKSSIAVDQKLPYGLLLTADFTYNVNMSAIKYENLNLAAPIKNLTGADTRPQYNASARINPKYDGIYLASNTSEGKAWNTSFTLAKNYISSFIDVNVSATYAYGESTVLFDATSSQNNSQWRFIETVNGSNNIGGVSRSDFDQGSRFLANSSLNFKWSKYTKSKIGLFYEGAAGTPISYVYNDGGRLLNDTGASGSALIFVPAKQSDINFVTTTTNTLTQQQQWDELNAFIESNDYLKSRRGQYAERNGDRLKTSHVIDLKFAQEFILNIKNRKHTLEISADIFNFTNLLNKDWGKRYFAGNDQVSLINQIGFLSDGTTPTFNYNPIAAKNLNQIDDSGLQSSRWQMQLGVRYTFK